MIDHRSDPTFVPIEDFNADPIKYVNLLPPSKMYWACHEAVGEAIESVENGQKVWRRGVKRIGVVIGDKYGP